MERVADDMWSMGLTPEATAIALVRDYLNERGVTRAAALIGARFSSARRRRRDHRQHPETANGAVFINLEDETGHVNVIFSKGAWARWSLVARKSPALMIRGTLQRGQGRWLSRPSSSSHYVWARPRRHATGTDTASPRRDHCAITRTARIRVTRF